jgi:hypothetical protein
MTAAPRDAMGLLFSGGLDSTLEAVERLEVLPEIHLLTFNNGCCVNMDGARRRAQELRDRYGAARIHFAEVDTGPLRRKLLYETEGRLWKYKSPLVFDLACKMAAVVELIHHARIHGLSRIADGAAIEQTQVFIQHPEMSAHIRPLFERYGVEMVRPVLFDRTRAEKIQRLKALGLASGSPLLETIHITSQLRNQPFCVYGFVTFFFTSPLRHVPLVKKFALPMDQAKQAWDDVLPFAQRELDARLARTPDGEGR